MKNLMVATLALSSVGAFAREYSVIPHSMAAIGDSTSTATLAQYKRSQVMNPLLHIPITLEFLLMLLKGGDRYVLADWNLSWSTGMNARKVKSHALRLKALNPKISVKNFSIPGAGINNVRDTQLAQLKQWSLQAYKQNYPDYVTLMIGANDLCTANLKTTQFAKSFSATYFQIVNSILKESPKTRILISPLARFQDLKKSKDAPHLFFPKMRTCEQIWKLIPLCPNLTHGSEEQTREVARTVENINQRLRAMTTSLREDYGDRVRYAAKVEQRTIEAKDLSIDCFHPNYNAQHDLAEITWPYTWWAH